MGALEEALDRSPVVGFPPMQTPVTEAAANEVCPKKLEGPPRLSVPVAEKVPLLMAIRNANGGRLPRGPNDFTWASRNPMVASAAGAFVTGIKTGTTTIHVADKLSDLELDVVVEVVAVAQCDDDVCTYPETAESCPSDCACPPDEEYTDGCGCIDPETEECCTYTGGDPEVIDLGGKCCPTHFRCQPGEYWSPSNGLDPYAQCCLGRFYPDLGCEAGFNRLAAAKPTVFDYECQGPMDEMFVCVTDDYKMCQGL